MSRLIAALIVTVPAIAVAVPVSAQGNGDAAPGVAVARLNGFQEVPAISTNGKGRFFAEISPDAVSYRLEYSGLENEVTQAHIHFGRRATNGGISVFLCSNLDDASMGAQPCPTGDGEITGTIVAGDVVGPEEQGIAPGEFEELLRASQNGAGYVNVHTTGYPAGEIRGQIAEVLEEDDHEKR
jgi:CHRD domain